MFCGCATTFGAPPNTQTCPVCLGMPGIAAGHQPPRRRVRRPHRAGPRAAGSTTSCRFARKHYYYPDMPKNYQISQYEEPLAEDGALEIDVGGAARATSASSACTSRRTPASSCTRATLETASRAWSTSTAPGVPLMEIVSRARPALARGGRRVSASPPRRAALPRRLRRQHGRGLAALRRQRLAAAAAARPSSAPRSRSRT